MAAAIAQSYGLPAPTLTQRMAAGRFRVKSGIDQQTAQALAADLVEKGAVCCIADEHGAVLARLPQAAPAAAPTPAQPSAPDQHYESSLSAAFAGGGQADLGALANSMDGLTLATLDGQEEQLGDDNSDEPTRPAVSLASFAPPSADEQPLHLAEIPGAVAKRQVGGPTPQAGASSNQSAASHGEAHDSTPAQRRSARSLPRPPGTMAPAPYSDEPETPRAEPRHHARGGVAVEENAFDRVRTRLADTPRLRFAVGVFAALLLGFLPAMLYAQSGTSDIAELRAALVAEQEQARGDLDRWNLLDSRRAAVLAEMESSQQNITIGGLLIWLLCAGGLAFLWFMKIDWQFYRTPTARAPAARRSPAPSTA